MLAALPLMWLFLLYLISNEASDNLVAFLHHLKSEGTVEAEVNTAYRKGVIWHLLSQHKKEREKKNTKWQQQARRPMNRSKTFLPLPKWEQPENLIYHWILIYIEKRENYSDFTYDKII